MTVRKDDTMDNVTTADSHDDFDALLDASSLGAPHVLAACEPIPEDVRHRLRGAVGSSAAAHQPASSSEAEAAGRATDPAATGEERTEAPCPSQTHQPSQPFVLSHSTGTGKTAVFISYSSSAREREGGNRLRNALRRQAEWPRTPDAERDARAALRRLLMAHRARATNLDELTGSMLLIQHSPQSRRTAALMLLAETASRLAVPALEPDQQPGTFCHAVHQTEASRQRRDHLRELLAQRADMPWLTYREGERPRLVVLRRRELWPHDAAPSVKPFPSFPMPSYEDCWERFLHQVVSPQPVGKTHVRLGEIAHHDRERPGAACWERERMWRMRLLSYDPEDGGWPEAHRLRVSRLLRYWAAQVCRCSWRRDEAKDGIPPSVRDALTASRNDRFERGLSALRERLPQDARDRGLSGLINAIQGMECTSEAETVPELLLPPPTNQGSQGLPWTAVWGNGLERTCSASLSWMRPVTNQGSAGKPAHGDRAAPKDSARVSSWSEVANGGPVLHADLRMRWHADEADGGSPLAARFSYRSTDPFAIEVVFSPRQPDETVWIFARDLLREGLETSTGDGDVIVWSDRPSPPGGSAEEPRTFIRLRSPHGTALLSVQHAHLTDYLDQTQEMVPAGMEQQYLDSAFNDFERDIGEYTRLGPGC